MDWSRIWTTFKCQVIIICDIQGGKEEGGEFLPLYPKKVAESPLLVHFVEQSLQHLPFEDQDRENLR
jgi:hypothetical protein